jgi:histidine triad (HIT) family protein
VDKQAMDMAAYEQRVRNGPCFICRVVSGRASYQHEVVLEDDEHIAFLDRYPTLPAKALVSPKRHLEHVIRDLDETAYLRLMRFVRIVAQAVEAAVPVERTYIYTLGSQQGNAHLHWHVAGLPPGTPYGEQQLHALMTENGVLAVTEQDQAEIAGRLRSAARSIYDDAGHDVGETRF